jgi:glycosyltransferase involved in cell wall biosynthesis
MKIAIFTDNYHPSTNGIVYVVDVLYENLYQLGHDVTIVAPKPGVRNRGNPVVPGKKVVWIPAIEGLLYDEYLVSVFLPIRTVKKLEKRNFEAVIFITPGQVGMLGVYLARRNKLILVEQYSTDLVEYIKLYPNVLPAVIALSAISSFILKLKEVVKIPLKVIKPNKNLVWSQKMARAVLESLHNSCDLVVTVSRKNYQELSKQNIEPKVVYIPTNVNKPQTSELGPKKIRQKYKIAKSEKVILYVGRLAKEKNIELLLNAFERVAANDPKIKLLIVGDFDYREHLEGIARSSKFAESIIFTGRISHAEIGNYYAAADIFAFPSLTDTQAFVLNEAAYAGLPIVWCDPLVNEVVEDGLNGILAKPNIKEFSYSLSKLLKDNKLRKQYSEASARAAHNFDKKKIPQKLSEEILKLAKEH